MTSDGDGGGGGDGTPTVPDGAENLRDRLRRALLTAMKARDERAVAALRSALAAIDNAEAVDAEAVDAGAVDALETPPTTGGQPDFAGTVPGLGAAEVERRSLAAAEMEAIVRAEMADRQAAARTYEQAGQPAYAARLRAEAKVLGTYLGPTDPPA